LPDLPHICDISTLKITPENYRADRDDSSSSSIEAFDIPIYFFKIYKREVLIRKSVKELQFESFTMLLLSSFSGEF
jgi:hypothetical protein